ncbi:AAA family ATPase [Nonomuraea sp. B19D2]|uniref:ATP-binding protein n=1 Tax=Nonomuraea sp. B19D2 TaxID=3159561 RepID=UPI0032DA9CFB
MLYGRTAEQAVLRRLISEAAGGVSGALVIRGEPGIGKSALLADAAETARAGNYMWVLRGVGVESEAQLPFAGLHLLLRPALGNLAGLPEPQRRALEAAFGLGPAIPADRMLVGLAVLTLLSALADEGPLLCLVDDAQWLDRPSAEALVFAVRRLGAEPVAVILAVRDGTAHLPTTGLSELRLRGLDPQDAAALVDAQGGGLAPDMRHRVLREAEGNPLALIELPTALSTGAGSSSPQGGNLPLTDRLQAAFHGQVTRLPEATRTLLLIAAADDTGELPVLLNAAQSMSSGINDLAPALDAGLVLLEEGDRRLSFRHPLVRAAVYQGAPLHLRLCAHRALAKSLGGPEHADRRAWHLAAAATGPDEHVAAELERAAVQAGERNGHAAAATAYERAASLSADGDARGRRLTLAAESAAQAGLLSTARALAERAAPQVTRPLARARLVRVLAAVMAGDGSLRGANDLLLAEAVKTDQHSAFGVVMEAVGNAWFAGDLDMAVQAAVHLDALQLDAGDPLLPVHQLNDWIISLVLGRSTDHLPSMAKVVLAANDIHLDHARNRTHIIGLGLIAGLDAWSLDLANTVVADSRARGAIADLPAALYHAAITETLLGRHRDAAASATEALSIAQDTGQWQWISLASGVLAYHAAIEGDEERARGLAAGTRTDSRDRVSSPGIHRAEWALGLLDLGYGRAETALERLEPLGLGDGRHQLPGERSAPDLIEAAVRIGVPERATGPYARFEDVARRVRQASIDALLERCRALLSPDERAEEHYAAALHSHEHDSRPFEHARTMLLYGEWLRRARRKSEAREHLRAALAAFDHINARPWAERARIELDATGLAVKRRQAQGALSQLTPQELQITRLAAQGLTNRDIAAQLFLSPRTVGHHLYKAYPKLGVTSRSELATLHLTD